MPILSRLPLPIGLWGRGAASPSAEAFGDGKRDAIQDVVLAGDEVGYLAAGVGHGSAHATHKRVPHECSGAVWVARSVGDRAACGALCWHRKF